MDRTDHTRRTILIGVLLGALTLASYWPVLRNEFVTFDDPDYVSENPYVLRGLTWQNAAWAFQTAHVANWHPLTWLSHMLDVQLFGLNPVGHHLTSLLFHLANTCLLFAVLRRMTGAVWRSAVVAALFAVHPLHVESVAWVSERKDVLSTLFFMLTLWAYARYAEGRRKKEEGRMQNPALPNTQHATRYYLLSLFFFACGLMSKAMLVTLPFVLLLLDYWPLRRLKLNTQNSTLKTLLPLVREKLPFLLLAAASSAVTFATQQNAGAVRSLEAFSPGFRIANAVVSYARYLGKMIWPARLAAFYPAPTEWPLAWVFGAALLLAALTALCLWQVKRAPYLAVGWFWYLGTLVPVIGIVQVGAQSMADRYTYLPLIGLFIALVWAAAEWGRADSSFGETVAADGSQRTFPQSVKSAPTAVGGYTLDPSRLRGDILRTGAAAVVLLLCAALTWRQAGCWRTTASLFAHALAVTKDNEVAENDLGACLLKEGNVAAAEPRGELSAATRQFPVLKEGNVAAAEPHFAEAVRIRPNYPDALVNLALCRYAQGRVPEAIDYFQRALDILPTPSGHFNLANVLKAQGRPQEAEAHYRAALRLRPFFVEAWFNLGALKADQGDAEAAAQAYAAALQFRPDYANAHLNLGQVLMVQHKWDEAIAHLRTGLRAAPQNEKAHFALGAALASTKQYAEAAVQFAEACRLHPDYIEARESLGQALFFQGKLPEAMPELRRALQARPSAMNHYYLALALHAQRQLDEALPHYREAARLAPDKPAYLNDLAWVLATHPRAEVRDGNQAVRLAERACQLTQFREPMFVGTLAAAYAEAGRFPDAVKTAERAQDLAAAAGLKKLAERNQQLLELYRAGKPYHEPEGKP